MACAGPRAPGLGLAAGWIGAPSRLGLAASQHFAGNQYLGAAAMCQGIVCQASAQAQLSSGGTSSAVEECRRSGMVSLHHYIVL
jgi:hypothetical protein